MNERIREFLSAENKSSSQLAEEIGVQPSGISHILSGRNNPSLDFVLKMLEKYQFLSTDWLLFGKGSMYKDNKIQTLFDTIEVNDNAGDASQPAIENESDKLAFQKDKIIKPTDDKNISSKKGSYEVKKIVWFYDDNSFEEYFPSR